MGTKYELNSSLKLRRKPVQQRSQERVERIVAVAEKIALEKGIAALSIREVARESDTNIASFYQFFPTKNALIMYIAKKYATLLRERLIELIPSLDFSDPVAALAGLQNTIFKFYLDTPIMMEIWPGTLSDLELRKYDELDTETNAELLVDMIKGFRPDADKEKCQALARYLAYTLGPLYRRLTKLPPKQRQAVLDVNLQSTLVALKTL